MYIDAAFTSVGFPLVEKMQFVQMNNILHPVCTLFFADQGFSLKREPSCLVVDPHDGTFSSSTLRTLCNKSVRRLGREVSLSVVSSKGLCRSCWLELNDPAGYESLYVCWLTSLVGLDDTLKLAEDFLKACLDTGKLVLINARLSDVIETDSEFTLADLSSKLNTLMFSIRSSIGLLVAYSNKASFDYAKSYYTRVQAIQSALKSLVDVDKVLKNTFEFYKKSAFFNLAGLDLSKYSTALGVEKYEQLTYLITNYWLPTRRSGDQLVADQKFIDSLPEEFFHVSALFPKKALLNPSDFIDFGVYLQAELALNSKHISREILDCLEVSFLEASSFENMSRRVYCLKKMSRSASASVFLLSKDTAAENIFSLPRMFSEGFSVLGPVLKTDADDMLKLAASLCETGDFKKALAAARLAVLE